MPSTAIGNGAVHKYEHGQRVTRVVVNSGGSQRWAAIVEADQLVPEL